MASSSSPKEGGKRSAADAELQADDPLAERSKARVKSEDINEEEAAAHASREAHSGNNSATVSDDNSAGPPPATQAQPTSTTQAPPPVLLDSDYGKMQSFMNELITLTSRLKSRALAYHQEIGTLLQVSSLLKL